MTDHTHRTGELVHHGLLTLRDRGGIYWLRLYRSVPSVAVVTEVPGNPGPSAVNAIEMVMEEVGARFRQGSAVRIWFVIIPRGAHGARQRSMWRVALGPRRPWDDVTRRDIERVIGLRLRPLPAHRELYAMVRRAGGGSTVEESRDVFEAIPVQDFPAPHNPSRCDHYTRFQRIGRDLAGPHDEPDWQRVGRAFLASLTSADIAKCTRHDADWRAIADASAAVVDRLGHCDADAYVAAAQRIRLPKRERDLLVWLFRDPIVLTRCSFNNGQHRGCAIRFSGAERAVVVTGREKLGERYDDWIYRGGG